MVWHDFEKSPPDQGDKIVIVTNDGCSVALALMVEEGPLDGECAERLSDSFLDGAIWAKLPSDYILAFTEITEDDWY